ncbi:hypothetical protein R1sor_013155 [Riccia sorocarpa]|uniref:Uncharacterized protein n=1 Tax=Riccia sorocarpa TaxID=122646 RepID=A0ABD3H9S8_9MARC
MDRVEGDEPDSENDGGANGDGDSSVNPESNVDDSDEPTGKEEVYNGKRKRGVGDNTRFLVDGMRGTMKELGDVMSKLESERLGIEKQLEQDHLDHHSRNCDKFCDVLKMVAGAMDRMSTGPEV